MHQHKGKIPSIYDDFDDMLICRLAASQVLPMFVSVSVADGGDLCLTPSCNLRGPLKDQGGLHAHITTV